MLARSGTAIRTLTPNLAADSVAATTAYADKDVVGDHLTVPNVSQDQGGTAILQSILVRSKVATAMKLEVYLLNQAPANSYGNNNSAFALDDTDLLKVVGHVVIDTTDYTDADTLNVVGKKANLGLPVKCKAGTKDLYAIVVTRTVVTFGAAGDLEIDLGFLQD